MVYCSIDTDEEFSPIIFLWNQCGNSIALDQPSDLSTPFLEDRPVLLLFHCTDLQWILHTAQQFHIFFSHLAVPVIFLQISSSSQRSCLLPLREKRVLCWFHATKSITSHVFSHLFCSLFRPVLMQDVVSFSVKGQFFTYVFVSSRVLSI